jgi:RNA polymerase-binding transcription factor DksA
MNIEMYKQKLEAERAKLEAELATVGRVNPDNPNDWEPIPSDPGMRESDPNDKADMIEDYETNTAILKQLEIQLHDVKDALAKIEAGTYGICEVSGKPIEEGRLNANPAARTCMEHMNG